MLFFNIKSIDSKIKGILNLGWICSLYFNKKYLTASIPKVCGMFVYRPTTSKVAITVFPSVFLSHLLRKSIPSLSSSATDQQTVSFFIRKPISSGAGENKTKSIKAIAKTFSKKTKKPYKRQKENTKRRRNATNTN